MDELIFFGKVADTFKLIGIPGIVVVPESQWVTPLSDVSQLILLKPDSQTLIVEFGGVVLVRTARTIKTFVAPIAITSEKISTAEDVPVGSTLWITPTR